MEIADFARLQGKLATELTSSNNVPIQISSFSKMLRGNFFWRPSRWDLDGKFRWSQEFLWSKLRDYLSTAPLRLELQPLQMDHPKQLFRSKGADKKHPMAREIPGSKKKWIKKRCVTCWVIWRHVVASESKRKQEQRRADGCSLVGLTNLSTWASRFPVSICFSTVSKQGLEAQAVQVVWHARSATDRATWRIPLNRWSLWLQDNYCTPGRSL